MFKRIFVAALVFGSAATAPPPADAQMLCAPRERLVERLSADYSERQRGIGVRGPAAVYELWASDGGSWTLLLTRPNGVSCLVADGTHWTDAPAAGPEAAPVADDPA